MSKSSLVRYTLKGTLYLSWILGMFPFKIDFRNRKLHSSKWMLAYGLVLNLFLLCMWHYSERSDLGELKIFARNPLAKKIQMMLEILIVVWCALGYWRATWKHKTLLEFLKKMIIIGRDLDQFAIGACPQLDKYVLMKVVVMVLVNITIFEINIAFYIFSVGPVKDIRYIRILSDICYYLVNLGNEMIMLHFYLAVLQIYCFFWNINKQLREILNHLKMDGTADILRVKILLRLYGEVLDLKSSLTSIYDLQVILFMVTQMCSNITMAYILIFLLANAKQSIIMAISVLSQFLVVTIWNLWLTVVSCDLVESEGTETRRILRLFADVFNMDQELERTVSANPISLANNNMIIFNSDK